MKKIISNFFVLSIILILGTCGFIQADEVPQEVTLDPNSMGAGVVLSNGNLTAQVPSSKLVKATIGKTSGKWYWEVKVDEMNSAGYAGVCCSINKSVGQTPSTGESIGYTPDGGGYVYANGAGNYINNKYIVGDIIGVALDVDNNKIAFYKNGTKVVGSDYNLPFTGAAYAAVGSGGTSSGTYTINFGGSSFSYSIPEGYLPYNASNIVNAPTNLVATAGDRKVTLSWTEVPGATYNVRRSGTAGGPYDDLIKTGITGTDYPDEGLDNGTTYYYVVTAVTSAGESVYSNEASAIPKASTSKNKIMIKTDDGLIYSGDLVEENDKEFKLKNIYLVNGIPGLTSSTGTTYDWEVSFFKNKIIWYYYGK